MPLTCSGCGRQFASLSGFDGHRHGKHTGEHPHYGRSCHDDDELREMGWRRTDGVWRMPAGDRTWLDSLRLSG